ncbi:MAG: N-acetyltransferase [Oscillospiraceae bacterium]
MEIIVRQETKSEIESVYHVVKSAFETAEFSDHDEQNLVNRLRNSKAFIPELSLVAEVNNQIVGYILFTEITVGDTTLLALAPVAVLPEMQGKGVGTKLINEGHKFAQEMGYIGCVVLGHSEYYPRYGYNKARSYGIVAPFEISDDHFMVIEFKHLALKNVSGVVQYAQEFFE